jgi:hypothetical protein
LFTRTKTVPALVAIAALALPGAALALPNDAADNGNGVGGCIDNLHGNATNPRPDGPGVLPSISPGPHTVGGGFLSVGEVHQAAKVIAPDANGREVNEAICLFP